jgi:hypothetical protein
MLRPPVTIWVEGGGATLIREGLRNTRSLAPKTSAIASLSGFSLSGPWTTTPVSNPPKATVLAVSSATVRPASRNAPMICCASRQASASVEYESTCTTWPRKGRQASVSVFGSLRFLGCVRALSCATSISLMDCKWPENIYTPASPANSPKRLIATIQTKTCTGELDHFIQRGSFPCSSRYSPAAPYARTKPQIRSSNSDPSSQFSVADFDRESKYPISRYRLLAGLGILITGVVVSLAYCLRGCAIILAVMSNPSSKLTE